MSNEPISGLPLGTPKLTDIFPGTDTTDNISKRYISEEIKKIYNENLTKKIYINFNTGVDAAGNGTEQSPYKTLAFAQTQVTDASATNGYEYIWGGRLSEGNFNIRPFEVYDTRFVPSNVSGSITADSAFDGITSFSVLKNFNGTINVNSALHFDGMGAHTTNLFFENVYVNNNFEFYIYGTSNETVFINNFSSSDYTLKLFLYDIYSYVDGCALDTAKAINTGNYLDSSCNLSVNSISNFFTCGSNGAKTQTVNYIANSFGGLEISGANTVNNIDAVSFKDPLLQSGATTANYNLTTISSGIDVDYAPTHYTPTSDNLDGHLQGIDGALVNAASDVNSFNGRAGDVVSEAGDYSFIQISGQLNLASQANGILPSTSLPALTGDVTSTSGSGATTLSSVGTPVSNQLVRLTTDEKGRVTGTSSVESLDITDALGYTPLSTAGGTMTGDITMSGGHTISGLPMPSSALDAATKGYVDIAVTTGNNTHKSCYAATVSNLNATYIPGTAGGSPDTGAGVGASLTNSGALAAFSVDGEMPPINSRILVKDEVTQQWNGIYVLSIVGDGVTPWVLIRSSDYDNSTYGEVTDGDVVFIQNGTDNQGFWFKQDSAGTQSPGNVIIIGTEPITFIDIASSIAYEAGTGLSLSGVTFYNEGLLSFNSRTGDVIFLSSDLPNEGTPVSDSFKKITTDSKGRVSATSDVNASDITTALGYTPLDVASNLSDLANRISATGNLGFATGVVDYPSQTSPIILANTIPDLITAEFITTLFTDRIITLAPVNQSNSLQVGKIFSIRNTSSDPTKTIRIFTAIQGTLIYTLSAGEQINLRLKSNSLSGGTWENADPTDGTGNISGTISAAQVAYGSAPNVIAGSASLTYDSSTKQFSVSDVNGKMVVGAFGLNYIKYDATLNSLVMFGVSPKFGIGNSLPNTYLQFDNSQVYDKIVLYTPGGAYNPYQISGMGPIPGGNAYSVSAITDFHAFFAGASSSSRQEQARIQGFSGGGASIGISGAIPTIASQIKFDNALTSRKEQYYTTVDNDHQVYSRGVIAGTLVDQLDQVATDYEIRHGTSSSTSVERLRVKSNEVIAGLGASTIFGDKVRGQIYFQGGSSSGTVGTSDTPIGASGMLITANNYIDLPSNNQIRWIAPYTGWLRFNIVLGYSMAGGAQDTIMTVYKNGIPIVGAYSKMRNTGGQVFPQSVSGLVQMSTNDVISVYLAMGSASRTITYDWMTATLS